MTNFFGALRRGCVSNFKFVPALLGGTLNHTHSLTHLYIKIRYCINVQMQAHAMACIGFRHIP